MKDLTEKFFIWKKDTSEEYESETARLVCTHHGTAQIDTA
jgi:hypothetical protein